MRSAYALPICFALSGLTGLAVLYVTPEPGDDVFTIVFPPNMKFDEVASRLHNAGAELLTSGARDHIVIARLRDPQRKAALRDAGALLFLSADASSFCGKDTTNFESRAL